MKEPKFYRRFDYDRSLLPNRYVAKLEDGVTDLEAAKAKTGNTVGYPGWNLLYFSLLTTLKEERFNLVVETGTNFGCSTIMLAQALKDSGYNGEVVSMEIDKKAYRRAVRNVKKARVSELVRLHHADSLEFLESFKPQQPIAFAFLDGNHLKQHVIKEFELIWPYLNDESVVFFDNTYLIDEEDGRVYEAIREIVSRYGGNIVNFPTTSWYTPGQAIWQKNAFGL